MSEIIAIDLNLSLRTKNVLFYIDKKNEKGYLTITLMCKNI